MAFAVTLACLNRTAHPIRELWEEAGAFDRMATMRSLNYVPHITLGIFDIRDPAPLLSFVVGATRFDRQAICFRSLHLFEGPPGVLWARPCPGADLEAMHRELLRCVGTTSCREHYRADRWIPHCTLAMNTDQDLRRDAERWIAKREINLRVVFDTVECVRLDPVQVIGRTSLRRGVSR